MYVLFLDRKISEYKGVNQPRKVRLNGWERRFLEHQQNEDYFMQLIIFVKHKETALIEKNGD